MGERVDPSSIETPKELALAETVKSINEASFISDAHSLSSLDLKTCTLSLDITVSGNEFQSLMAAFVEKFCLAVVLGSSWSQS